MSEIKYRQAGGDDLADVMSLGRSMAAESPRFSFLNYDEEKLLKVLEIVIGQGGLFVAHKGDVLIGFFIGIVSEHYFSPDLVAHDLAVYVHADYRKGMTGVRLIKIFEKWAFEEMNVRVVSVSSNTGVKPERTLQLFTKLGYDNGGNNLWKRNPADV